MKQLAAFALIMLVAGIVQAEDSRELAGLKDFKQDYREKIEDKEAAIRAQRAEDRRQHQKYLREISRSR